jgi:regulator of cell morphogenesis and NO signaling
MITEQQTVAEVAASSHAAVRIFAKHGIDFCCGGQRPIADVCTEKRVSAPALIAELEDGIAGAPADTKDWNTAPFAELIEHILNRHHSYLRSELPRIQGWLDKVHSKYGVKDAESIGRIPAVYHALRAELESHIQKEEIILFPAILRGNYAVSGPIHVMELEHESAGEALRLLRSFTNDYTVPEHACRTYRALFEGLQELEADLHVHIHLENNILFPRVQQLRDQAARS